ncbi:hypothetical protein CEXT_253901 [Caerostris extrusa]|uniref:Uncharacterized protein n=1 Tax=Caerostris extrusa TaxID=172846 RepID=A0AAV4XDF0_CAEEX|nr:hypothetical protein CEXT_253901 [Caerostris extrusa]
MSHLPKKEKHSHLFSLMLAQKANDTNRQPGISPSGSLINIYNSELHPPSPRMFLSPLLHSNSALRIQSAFREMYRFLKRRQKDKR